MLEAFGRHGCRSVVIGGIAAAMYGLTYETDDLDLLCDSSAENLVLLAAALTELGAVVAGSTKPPRPIEPDMLSGFRILTFSTEAGDVDLLFEAKGGFRYADVVEGAIEVDVGGAKASVCGRRQLIELKRASGRPHDMKAAAELEAGELAREAIGAVPGTDAPTDQTEPGWLTDLLREPRSTSGPELEGPG